MDYDAAYDADQQDAGAQPQATPAPAPAEPATTPDEPTQDQPAADVFQNALQAPPPAPAPAVAAHKDEKKFGNGLDAWTTDDNGGYVFHIFNGGPKTVSCRLDLSYIRESTTGDKIFDQPEETDDRVLRVGPGKTQYYGRKGEGPTSSYWVKGEGWKVSCT
jgi:hypothetical protein